MNTQSDGHLSQHGVTAPRRFRFYCCICGVAPPPATSSLHRLSEVTFRPVRTVKKNSCYSHSTSTFDNLNGAGVRPRFVTEFHAYMTSISRATFMSLNELQARRDNDTRRRVSRHSLEGGLFVIAVENTGLYKITCKAHGPGLAWNLPLPAPSIPLQVRPVFFPGEYAV